MDLIDELAQRFPERESLAAYKVPRLFRFVAETELPLTTTGKLQKNRLASTFFADRLESE
ncbi:MAG: hypothetical protein EXR33_04860 [Betaproteobacteria bacterium]|nr:hypothetical protein [Betaproteobacteria bacterium]